MRIVGFNFGFWVHQDSGGWKALLAAVILAQSQPSIKPIGAFPASVAAVIAAREN